MKQNMKGRVVWSDVPNALLSGILPEKVSYSQDMMKDGVVCDYEGHYKKNGVEFVDLHNIKKPFLDG